MGLLDDGIIIHDHGGVIVSGDAGEDLPGMVAVVRVVSNDRILDPNGAVVVVADKEDCGAVGVYFVVLDGV